jgi:hypothetical protein
MLNDPESHPFRRVPPLSGRMPSIHSNGLISLIIQTIFCLTVKICQMQ